MSKILQAICLLFIVSSLSAREDKPNVIFILADDMGWADLGYNGHKFFETPNIDKMVQDGMKLDAMYAGGPNCAPTRACLISGMYTPRTHIYQPGSKSKGPFNKMRLLTGSKYFKTYNDKMDPKVTSIAEVIKTAGYKTARLGKWHLGKTDNHLQGFDISTSNGQNGPHSKHYGSKTVAESLTDRALEFIEENKNQPFFLYLSHWDVHGPIRAKNSLIEKYKAKNKKKGTNFNPAYAGMMEQVDTSVARVRAKVEELGLAENTLIIFTSDNGGVDKYTSNKPLTGVKGSLFEGGVRVGGVAYWKGTIKPGSVSNTPVTSVDLMPTLADISGAALPTNQPVDGRSILPILKGEKNDLYTRAIFWHYPFYLQGVKEGALIPVYGTKNKIWRGTPSSAIRKGDWKLMWYFEDNSTKLFNIKEDPYEKNDLSKENPEMNSKMLQILKGWVKETSAPVPSKINPKFKAK